MYIVLNFIHYVYRAPSFFPSLLLRSSSDVGVYFNKKKIYAGDDYLLGLFQVPRRHTHIHKPWRNHVIPPRIFGSVNPDATRRRST